MDKYIKIHRDPYANLLSANYGVERSGGFQMPLRLHMHDLVHTHVLSTSREVHKGALVQLY